MATEQWPDLGRYLAPLEQKPQPAVRRTPMEDGTVKQREFLTRQRTEHPLTIRMTAAEYTQFKAWYRTNIAHGAQWFDWVDPADGATKSALIQNGQYDAKTRNAGEGADVEWELTLTLETWDA